MADIDEIVLDDEAGDVTPPPRSSKVSSEDLASLLNKERRERQAAQQRATTAEQRASAAERNVASEVEARYNSEVTAVDAAIIAATSDADRLEADLAAKQEAGDFRGAAQAMRAMQAAQAKLINYENRKDWLASNKAMIVTPTRQPQPAQQADMSRYTPAQRQWIEAHPDYLTDEGYRNEVAGYHSGAVRRGIKVDTPEYFQYIERRLGDDEQGSVAEPEQEAVIEQQPTAKAAAAMPVQRRATTTGTSSTGPLVLKLSPEEREAADITMPDVPVNDYDMNGARMPGRYKAYALNKRRLSSEGRI